MGSVPQIIGVSYWSDAGLLQGIKKIPTVIFGPGKIEVAHSPGEFVEISQIIHAAKVLACLALITCLPIKE
jgi:acetylornithine deacetylase/succinyl-diaminopimelate desuccinylase-like protein